jgi:WD40 repeat protein
VKFVPNSSGFRVVTAGGCGEIHLADICSGGTCSSVREVDVFHHEMPVTGLGFHPDDPNNMIYVCLDGTISRLDLREKSSTRLLMVNGILVFM